MDGATAQFLQMTEPWALSRRQRFCLTKSLQGKGWIGAYVFLLVEKCFSPRYS